MQMHRLSTIATIARLLALVDAGARSHRGTGIRIGNNGTAMPSDLASVAEQRNGGWVSATGDAV